MKRILLIAFFLCTTVLTSHSQMAIIANASVPEASVSTSQLLDICMLGMRTWSDGQAIELMLLRDNSSEEREFFDLLHRTPLEMRKIWLRAQLSGQARPPALISSQDELLRRVEDTPGAIGFVNKHKVRGNVKILRLLE